jgi:CheY-like chemotaxis protein
VGVASSVAEALELVERGGFDLALLDINLNGAQSLPVAEALRERGLRFVFATGYGAAGRGEAFADVPFVTKPYRLKDLAEALEKAAA